MTMMLRRVWAGLVAPVLRQPRRQQVAALCHRGDGDGREYLLITSRETRRWIIPKGWPITGLSSNEAALQEAWEEAGVRGGDVSDRPVGTFTYDKRQDSGASVPVEAFVYSVAVTDLADNFPERAERTRKWVTAAAAARMVAEDELRNIFKARAA